MDQNVANLLLVTIPAAFTLAGTFAGTLLNQRAATEERRRDEDTTARNALAALTLPVTEISNYLVWGWRKQTQPEPEILKLLRERSSSAQTALMVAGLPWKTAGNALSYVTALAEFDLSKDAGHLDQHARTTILRAQEALDFLLQLMDKTRRIRRSRQAQARAAWMHSEAPEPVR